MEIGKITFYKNNEVLQLEVLVISLEKNHVIKHLHKLGLFLLYFKKHNMFYQHQNTISSGNNFYFHQHEQSIAAGSNVCPTLHTIQKSKKRVLGKIHYQFCFVDEVSQSEQNPGFRLIYSLIILRSKSFRRQFYLGAIFILRKMF